ncbi:hypothetical protein BpHYR1_018478, partial [Brachionus plicatilis]
RDSDFESTLIGRLCTICGGLKEDKILFKFHNFKSKSQNFLSIPASFGPSTWVKINSQEFGSNSLLKGDKI